MARSRCSTYFKLNEVVESLERQLIATEFCEPELPGLLEIVEKRRTLTALSILKARADLKEHMSACSKCVRWLM